MLVEVLEWDELGVELGLKTYKVQAIERNKRGDVGQCKMAMLDQWLRSDTAANWEKVIEALKRMPGGDRYNTTIERIQSEYLQGGGGGGGRLQNPGRVEFTV